MEILSLAGRTEEVTDWKWFLVSGLIFPKGVLGIPASSGEAGGGSEESVERPSEREGHKWGESADGGKSEREIIIL